MITQAGLCFIPNPVYDGDKALLSSRLTAFYLYFMSQCKWHQYRDQKAKLCELSRLPFRAKQREEFNKEIRALEKKLRQIFEQVDFSQL